ncbi:conserved hypothetical protein [Desulfonatronospira thiodismutans ASO3-1]|uniref:Uncharacterized protein n=1 Tax=Desulfonatronospira thiodismutans ASO3-1 TaxID=555779 RepID=D6SQC3_9BACT|nr:MULTISPECIES: hypothetical protein [Desulfonatronospira]EFI34949.1 conserved hypothetical protein [Desulfonatronospira thiodismutans ASO3-1]RQD74060.1 MAG: hypothetical protein D5S03_11300 [Desulfonatronospira sp. MSAO_Bac3]
MGEIIQIRVMAQTFDPEEAKKRWSDLAEAAFDMDSLQIKAEKDFHIKLVDALVDRNKLGQLSPNLKEAIQKDLQTAGQLRDKLQRSLSDWDPRAADRAAYELEDVLDRMQQNVVR